MDTTITSAALWEPLADRATASRRAVGVQLNLEVTALDGDDTIEPAAKTYFEDFLKAAPEARFAAYKYDSASGQLKLYYQPAAFLAPVANLHNNPPPGGWDAAIMGWLADRPTAGKWADREPADNVLTDADSLAAGQRLSGAQNWATPLPQQAGLTRLVEVDPADGSPPPALYVVPFFRQVAGSTPPERLTGTLEGAMVTFSYADPVTGTETSGLDWNGLNGVAASPDHGLPVDETSLIDPSGFLRVPPDAPGVADLLRRVRERAGAALWTAPQLIGLDWGGEPIAPDKDRKRLVWRAAAAVCSLLDPLFLALTMADQKRHGPFVAAMAAILSHDPFGKAREADQLATLAAAWPEPRGPLDQPQTRRKLVETAIALFGSGDWQTALGDWVRQLDKEAAEPNPDGKAAIVGAQGEYLGKRNDVILPLLLLFVKNAVDAWPWPEADPADLEAKLDRELGELVQAIGSETGIETAVLTYFEIDKPGWTSVETLLGGDRDKTAQAVAKYRSVLEGSFNGLEAARQAQGAIFARSIPKDIIDTARPPQTRPRTTTELEQGMRDLQWFAARCGLVSPPMSAALLEYLPVVVAADWLDASDQAFLIGSLEDGGLDAAFAQACRDVIESTERRFVPDTEPRNLSVRIAVDTDVTDGDLFDLDYDGVGVMIERDGAGWAHANLALLKPGYGGPNGSPTVLPLRPAVMDGERQLFLEFNGVPFAETPLPEDDRDEDDIRTEGGKPFYSWDSPAKNELGGHRPLPALAYGATFAMTAYAVSRSGVLPEGVAADTDFLTPRTDPAPPDERFVATMIYSRTTAVGRVGLEQLAPAAFEASLARIQPLSADYPRIGLCSGSGSDHFLDLWRNSDGTGAIVLPKQGEPPVRVKLHDLQASDLTAIRLSLLSNPATGVDAALQDVGVLTGEQILTIEATGATTFAARIGTSVLPLPSDFKDHPTAWLRLALAPEVGGTGSLNFADPAGAVTSRTAGARAVPDNFVVLGRGAEWHQDFTASPSFRVRYPAIGHDDFDRWMANPDLLTAACGTGPQTPSNKIGLEQFRIALLAAYLRADRRLGEHSGSIPDPAVEWLQVELVEIDKLGPASTASAIGFLEVPGIGTLLAGYTAQQDIFDRLDEIANSFSATIEVAAVASAALSLECSRRGGGGLIKVQAREGTTVRLTVRPMVPGTHFEASAAGNRVIDERVSQLAVGTCHHADRNHLVFDGPSVTIEVMAPFDKTVEWAARAHQWLNVRPSDTARRYELTLEPASVDAEWRLLGTADVVTQRWRFLGRPIHSWFDPKSCHFRRPEPTPDKSPPPLSPALRIAKTRAVEAFEEEAFARSDFDALQATVRLKPSGERSQLQTVDWEVPSATIFRHRVRLRSRYAGALKRAGQGEVWVVPSETVDPSQETEDWVRVVMLADRTQLQLTRPQLRALIPLTISPDERVTPPLLAMLTEPPFAHGGLADRIAFGVATSFGYEMQKATETQDRLGLENMARAESGPDPLHSYFPLRTDDALAMSLVAEGPLGLTYDRDSAPAPAFPNSAWALAPAETTDRQEHYYSVTTRRYLDPAWLVGEADPVSSEAWDFAETLWLQTDPDDELVAIKVDGIPVATVARNGRWWTVEVEKSAIFRKCHTGIGERVTLVHIEDPDIRAIALLHQPLEAGRAAMSVFAIRDGGPASLTAKGNGAPRQLASFEWRCPISPGKELQIRAAGHRTSASAPTAMEWARTGRNASLFDTAEGDRVQASDLRGVPDDDRVTFARSTDRLWLQSSLFGAPSPLYVHRHLALLPTTLAAGQGRALELFEQKKRQPRLMLGASGVLDQPGGCRIRIMEIEVPARPLGTASQMGEFRSAVFDLTAIGRKADATGGSGLLFFIRPVGGANQTAAPPRMNLSLEEDVPLDLGSPDTPTAAFIVRVFADSVKVGRIDGGGAFHAIPSNGKPAAIPAGKVALRLKADDDSAEWWADVSVLTIRDATSTLDGPELDFDWLFTGTPPPDLKEALGFAALRGLAEVEARVVRVSPPIDVDVL